MALTSGTRLGPYQIESLLGAGGMGEVYRARDTRLDRSVAIKVLPSALAADPEFRERFDREARAISQLTHPNICTLHDVGDDGGTAYLVMELLDGQTLAARIAKGAMSPAEALPLAVQIGEALAAAHRAGLVHRDLKPGNVMLTKSGAGSAGSPQAKLLDFGLAKATATVQSVSAGLTMMPTTPAAMTAHGAIVGTFQYMAPEQVEGHEADARTDIFAFGCVLHEMLTGRKAFEGKTHASLIGAIMHAEPQPPSGIVRSTSPSLDRIVRKCLAKDPDARWQSARDLVDELKWIAEAGTRTEPLASAPVRAAASSRVPWAVAIASMLVAAALGTTWLTLRRAGPEAQVPLIRFTLAMPDGWSLGSYPGSVSLSEDGKYLVLSGSGRNDAVKLWIRPLDASEAHPIPHTENAGMPFWSPDGLWIGFYDTVTRQLKKTDVNGTQISVIGEAANPQGAAWSREGVIVFGSPAGIYKVEAAGGTPVAVTRATPGQASHNRPVFLSDGRHFLYTIFATGIYVGSVDGSPPHQVTRTPPQPYALLGDELFFLRGTVLVSQRFDTRTFALVGEPRSVVSGVAQFVASPSVLAYTAPRGGGTDDLAWFDRGGQRVGVLGDRADYSNIELSPDGTHLATAMLDPRGRTHDIWIYDVVRGIRQRFTFGEGDERTAVWSPDGARVLYNVRGRTSALDFYQKLADGSGAEEPVLVDGMSKDALGWSPDGRHLLYRLSADVRGNDLWVLPTTGDRKPFAYSATPFDEQDGRISPDGRWAAYSTDESGQLEVYVARFPSGGGKTRISTAGGTHPRWRRDGKELFYVSLDNELVAVDITTAPDSLRVGNVHALFATHPPVQPGYNYEVTPDGKRFLLITDVGAASPLTIVTNWR